MLRIIVLLSFASLLSCSSTTNNQKLSQSSSPNDAPISESELAEFMLYQLYRETPLLLCYNDNFRICHNDSNIEACVIGVKAHEELIKESMDDLFPLVNSKETFLEYAGEFTQRSISARALVTGTQDEIMPCVLSLGISLRESKSKMDAEEPKTLQYLMGL